MSNKNKKNQHSGQISNLAKSQNSANIKNNNILTRFFSHNITLMVLSFVLAFTIWFIININSTTDSSETIEDIPIEIELSDDAKENGLEVFLNDEIKASVKVSGNRITVDSLTADDITVYAAQMDSIITPDVYTRPLTAKKSGIKNNYEIVSAVTPSSVTFRVDKRKTKTFDIVNNIQVDKPKGTHTAVKTISPTVIHVSGPEQEVNRIAMAEVAGSVTVGSSETTTKAFEILFRDVDGNLLTNLNMIETDVVEAQATVIVYPTKELTSSVQTSGDVPSGVPAFVCTPDTITVAGSQEALNKIQNDTFVVNSDQPISFSELDNDLHTFEFDLTAPTGCLIVLPDTKKVEVTLDLSSFDITTIQPTIVPVNIDTDVYNYEFLDLDSGKITVTICGPESKLKVLTERSLTVEADFENYLSDIQDSGVKTKDIPIKISLGSAYSDCWVYGTYKVSVDLSKK